MVVSIRSERVRYKLTVVVIVPISEVHRGVNTLDLREIGDGITISICSVCSNRAYKHTGITIPIVLIVTADVVKSIDLSCYVAVINYNRCPVLDLIRTSEHSHDTTTGNVPRAPKCGYLVCLINCNVLEGKLVIFVVRRRTTDTYNTAVTRVINAGVTVSNGNILERRGSCRISRDSSCGSKLTVRGEVINCKVLDSTIIYISEQTHCILVTMLGYGIIVIISDHLPGVLIEVGNSMSVSVKGTLEGRNATVRIVQVAVTVVVIGEVISDRIEYKCLILSVRKSGIVHLGVSFLSTEVDIVYQLDKLSVKIVSEVLTVFIDSHTTDDLTKAVELVSTSDNIGVLFSTRTIYKVPRIIGTAVPLRVAVSNNCNLREGAKCHLYVTCNGVIGVFVMCIELRIIYAVHQHVSAVLYVIEIEVAHIITCGHKSCYGYYDRRGVIRGYTADMYVNRT